MILHHVSVGVKDVEAAGRFYDAVLGALGLKRLRDHSSGAVAYGEPDGPPEFWVGLPHDRKRASSGNGTHIAFAARNIAAVQAFYKAALEHGAADEGEPGLRPQYGPHYYGGYARDLDGNKIEAVLRVEPRVAHVKLPKPAKAKTRTAGAKKDGPAKKSAAGKAGKTVAKKAAKKPAKKKKAKARKR